jgi:hypothetical protein
VDNKSAIDLANNPVYHKRSKHIDIKYHWLRQHVAKDGFKTVTLHHCTTLEMVADLFTKSLSGALLLKHSETVSGKRKRTLNQVMYLKKKREQGKVFR